MQGYELTVIMDPDIIEEDTPQALEKVSTLIDKSGGTVDEVNHRGRKRLAYPIDRHKEGNYVYLRLQLEAARTSELEADLNLASEYLRHLLVKLSD